MFRALNSWGHRKHLETTFFYVDLSLLYTLHQAIENCSFPCQWEFDVLKNLSDISVDQCLFSFGEKKPKNQRELYVQNEVLKLIEG